MALLLVGCATLHNIVTTPPDYVIAVNMSDTNQQGVGLSLENAQVVEVAQQQVWEKPCAFPQGAVCTDKIVIGVGGAPKSRVYSRNSNSGSSTGDDALHFQANGSNGSIDFSVTAIVLKENVKCYANKMGYAPVDGSKFYFHATPLEDALDSRILPIANSRFAQKVARTSPLSLSLGVFEIFDEIRPDVIKTIFDQTCITALDVSITSGVNWDSEEIQSQIDQATVIKNQLELVVKQNELLEVKNKAFIKRALEIEEEFGTQAAVEFMRIQAWDGHGIILPPLQQAPTNPVQNVITQTVQ